MWKAVPELDPEVLSGILVLQSALNAAPDRQRVVETVVAGLEELPGVAGCRVRLESGEYAATPGVPEAGEGGECGSLPESGSGIWRHALRTIRGLQGVLALAISDGEAFRPYEPLVSNTASLVALHLEGGESAERLSELNGTLERQIVERTESLSRREQQFRTLFETLPIGVMYFDAEGRVTSTNPAAARMPGLAALVAGGQVIREDGSPCPQGDLPGTVALRTGKPVVGVVLGIENGDEAPRWVLMDATPEFRAGDTRPYQVLLTFNDITERQRTQQALQASERNFRTLFDHSPIGAALLDPETGHVVDCNERAARSLGYAREEMKRLRVADCEAHRAEAEIRAALAATLEGQSPEFDTVLRTKAGELRDFYVKLARVEARGRALTFVAALDITERKVAERELTESREQLREWNTRLEATVRQRTEQLQAVNRELESFAYSVSHDLAAPLRGIHGWTDALEEDYGPGLDEIARQYLERIRTESGRMQKLIEALLQLSRVARVEGDRAAVDLSRVAEGVAGRLREMYAGRDLRFRIEPGVTVWGHPALMEVVLTNLLGNAAKFTARREQAVIEFGREQREGEAVYFVRDNGAGFEMKYAGALFGAFQRMHRQSEFPGTGIGLATVKRIILRHEGRIWAESAVGEGAAFFFTLPNPDTAAPTRL